MSTKTKTLSAKTQINSLKKLTSQLSEYWNKVRVEKSFYVSLNVSNWRERPISISLSQQPVNFLLKQKLNSALTISKELS